MTRDAPQHMRQPTASLHHVAFSTAKLLVLAGTTALHGEGIHAIASFNFASYICMFMCFYRRCVVIHVSWRKPPAATEETTGAGIQEFMSYYGITNCGRHGEFAAAHRWFLSQASAARWDHCSPKGGHPFFARC